MMQRQPMLDYLSQSGPFHPKHGGGVPPLSLCTSRKIPPLHPSLTFVTHYTVAIASIFYVHDTFFSKPHANGGHNDEQDQSSIGRQFIISRFLFIYVLILFTTRYVSSHYSGRIRQYSVFYELTWLCNSALVMGCLSFGIGIQWQSSSTTHNESLSWILQRRPMVASAACIAVSIDQILWYVDLLGYLFLQKFPIGVMKYLTWEQTLWIDRLTCTHHLWTIPLILYGANVELNWDSFYLSIYIVVIHVLLSRWMTPGCIQSGNDKKDPQHYRYLNVNLSHELWRDISLPFLQISIDNPPCWLYLFRLLWRWQLFNGIMFVAFLRPLSKFTVPTSW